MVALAGMSAAATAAAVTGVRAREGGYRGGGDRGASREGGYRGRSAAGVAVSASGVTGADMPEVTTAVETTPGRRDPWARPVTDNGRPTVVPVMVALAGMSAAATGGSDRGASREGGYRGASSREGGYRGGSDRVRAVRVATAGRVPVRVATRRR